MKYKRVLISFLLILCFDLLFHRFVFDEEFNAERISSAITSSLMVSLLWLIPIKSKKQLDAHFLRESGLQLLENENVVLQSVANQIHGAEVVGGKLFLTDQRLVFISTKSKIRQQELDRAQIASVEPHQEFAKAIVVVTNSNTTHAFNVDLHDQWMKAFA